MLSGGRTSARFDPLFRRTPTNQYQEVLHPLRQKLFNGPSFDLKGRSRFCEDWPFTSDYHRERLPLVQRVAEVIALAAEQGESSLAIERVCMEEYGDKKFRTELLARAIENENRMDGTTTPVAKIIAENDLVWGVWIDPLEEHCIGIHLINGRSVLSEVASGQEARELLCGAILCGCAEKAVAAQLVLGDGQDCPHTK